MRTHIEGLVQFSAHHPTAFSESRWSIFNPIYRGLRTWLLLHPQIPAVDPDVRVRLAARLRACDILHTHGHPVWTDLYKTARRWPMRRIHTVHQIYDEADAGTEREWRRLRTLNTNLIDYCRTARMTIAVSEDLHRRLAEAGVPEVVKIPNGVDLLALERADAERARRRFALPAGFVASIAHLGPTKNPRLLVEVARQLNPVPFVVMGAGMTRRELTGSGFDPPENLSCLGLLGRADALDVLAAADCFFLSSVREGQSTATLEALALGLPCVLPSLPAINEIVRGKRIAHVYEPGDASAAKDVIEAARGDRAMGQAARAAIQETYDWRRVASRLDSIYESAALG